MKRLLFCSLLVTMSAFAKNDKRKTASDVELRDDCSQMVSQVIALGTGQDASAVALSSKVMSQHQGHAGDHPRTTYNADIKFSNGTGSVVVEANDGGCFLDSISIKN